jgi:hypothetical protein
LPPSQRLSRREIVSVAEALIAAIGIDFCIGDRAGIRIAAYLNCVFAPGTGTFPAKQTK